MYLCYVDESGTPEIPGNTSHFVLAGISIPIWHWRNTDRSISTILIRYGLGSEELHAGWLLRKYLEQSRIPDFENLSWTQRRAAVERERNIYLLKLQQGHRGKAYQQAKKTYAHERPYIHLTLAERQNVAREIADSVSGWGSARLFAECIDKIHFDPVRTGCTADEQAFEQIVSRFEQYVESEDQPGDRRFGLLVHDNNATVARKHTDLMRRFHQRGTLWTRIERLIETPLFVDSKLTMMVQIADLCAHALRRYLENQEPDIFNRVFLRAHRIQNRVVGVRHYTGLNCACEICRAHRPAIQLAPPETAASLPTDS
jgi:hypothetical protein